MSVKKIDDFKAAVSGSGGFSRPNKFEIRLSSPAVVADPGEKISILAKAATIPGRQISTAENQTIRHPLKQPIMMVNDEVTLTFHLTNDYLARKLFKRWLDAVISPDLAYINYKNDYVGTVEIIQLDSSQTNVHTIKLTNAYPISLSSIELSSESENTISEVSVTFAYENFIESGEAHRTGRGIAIGTTRISSYDNLIGDAITGFVYGGFNRAVEPLIGEITNTITDATDNLVSRVTSPLSDFVSRSTMNNINNTVTSRITSPLNGKLRNLFR